MSNTKLPRLAGRRSRNPSPSDRRRAIIYWFSVPMMRDVDLSGLRAQIEALAADCGMMVVDFFVDMGPPKKRRGDYPMLARLDRGEADVLIVGRSDLRRRSPDQDWLESRTRPRSVALFTVAELRRLGVLDRKRAASLGEASHSVRARLRPALTENALRSASGPLGEPGLL
jgi:hypothetical protein